VFKKLVQGEKICACLESTKNLSAIAFGLKQTLLAKLI